MAKRFTINYANGFTQEFSAAQCYEANNTQNSGTETYMLSGQPVGAGEFYAAVDAACAAKLAKKEETHKRVKVLYGSSAACYVTKWVRK